MSSGSNLEISMHFIPLETPIDPARINYAPPPQPGGLGKLPTGVPPYLPHDMVRVHILLLRSKPRIILLVERLVFSRPATRMLIVALLRPHLPASGFTRERLASKDSIPSCILDIHAYIITGHFNDDVKIQLQLMRDALLDTKMVLFRAVEPGA